MFVQRITVAAGILATSVTAFPALSPDAAQVLSRGVASLDQSKDKRAVTFDPKAQLVDVTGTHAWVAPDFAAGDQRGPCAGLNSLANHG